MALFSMEEAEELANPAKALYAKCESCRLYTSCRSPKMPFSGKGKRKILLLGDSPGSTDDHTGAHFSGESGRLLEDALDDNGIDMRKDCWLTNSVICHNSNKLTRKEVEFCRANLTKTLDQLQPNVIVVLGEFALISILMGVFKAELQKYERWVGWRIPCQHHNRWICPVFDPKFVLEKSSKSDFDLVRLFWKKQLGKAVAKTKRPWRELPDYKKQVRTILDPDEVAEVLAAWSRTKQEVAFDYETTSLKPEAGEIVCCSVSDGETSVAYPWHGKAIEATKELIRSPVGKIGSNVKFEERWTRKHFGISVRNWVWDTMIASHWLDNRAGITGLKFQSYALLGFPTYNKHIEPYLESVDGTGTGKNNIHKIGLQQLLLYCGLDSLLEYKVAQIQKKKGGVE